MKKHSRSVALALLLAVVLVISSCGPSPSTPTSPVAVTQGQVRDAITTLPIAGVRLEIGTVTALSDVEGAFSMSSVGQQVITVTAPGYETIEVTPRPGVPLVVDLVPDASTTLAQLYDHEKRHEFGQEYDLLHLDVQAMFTREEFIRNMEWHLPYDLLDYSIGAVEILASGTILGKTYDQVAQVTVEATVRRGESTSREIWLAYAVKADGLWRAFRGPLVWPTPTVTATLPPTPTDTPTPTTTSTDAPTLVPTLTSTATSTGTSTPAATATSTPYVELLPPDSQAEVSVDAAALHFGPGQQYTVIWAMPRHSVVTILGWPTWVDGVPWYPVRLADPDLSGWCSGANLAPRAPTPTPSSTPTVPPGTPAPTATMPTPTPAPPTAQRIAFTSERDDNQEIYTISPDGTDLRNVSQHAAQDGGASWSPTRDRIAFVSGRSGNSDIFVVNADGSGLVQLTSSSADEVHPAWSPNGALIAYVSDEDGDWEIYAMSANGTGATQLTHNDAWDSYPSWCWDSQRLAFTSRRDGNYELYVYDLATAAATRLTDNPASDAFPAWAPYSEEIAFTSARDGQLELYVLDLAVTPHTITRLTYTSPASVANRYPSWSSDSQWLAFTTWRDGNAEIYVMHRSGAGLRNLTNHAATDSSPAWAD